MARKKIREYDAKRLLTWHLKRLQGIHIPVQVIQVTYGGPSLTELADMSSDFENNQTQVDGETTLQENGFGDQHLDVWSKDKSWLLENKLVVKPDMLFGKRGKSNLVKLNLSLEEASKAIENLIGSSLEVEGIRGRITHFIVEPFVEHDAEYYFSIQSCREGNLVSFGCCGGIDIEKHWDKVKQVVIPAGESPIVLDTLLANQDISRQIREQLEQFIKGCYLVFEDLDMTFLEMNPLTLNDRNHVIPLDMRCELDTYAVFKNQKKWLKIEFPESWGSQFTDEEQFIRSLDEKSGASLKLTLIHPKGHIWTMVAGGGASVIYADTVVDLGMGDELANYAEYSGNPKEEETYLFARTILDLATRYPDGKKRALLVGGGVANFTDIAATFAGIIQALKDFHGKLQVAKLKVFVRRGGPNYETGLRLMEELGDELDIPIEVYGPDSNMTCIVQQAIDWIKG
ncbi:ATP citrate (pro-S)-lyase [Galdieria sulphuraria]|uniref:ATP citrate synthase n=1 Tax=Galdieria sulphuraria TaxID=130081 RepID=M2Y6B6_GALSU|nr:ATP citrate (pro-S)-lyase [Galdieria sulphuraria]EME31389.1 ATP citrate (pro-S)-lyase [Galdieria sulphuraria]|eukprot:XP_005707909.1 ATP citrate (pro-S)-lyase [Galdieria sulphuraria]